MAKTHLIDPDATTRTYCGKRLGTRVKGTRHSAGATCSDCLAKAPTCKSPKAKLKLCLAPRPHPTGGGREGEVVADVLAPTPEGFAEATEVIAHMSRVLDQAHVREAAVNVFGAEVIKALIERGDGFSQKTRQAALKHKADLLTRSELLTANAQFRADLMTMVAADEDSHRALAPFVLNPVIRAIMYEIDPDAIAFADEVLVEEIAGVPEGLLEQVRGEIMEFSEAIACAIRDALSNPKET